MFHIHIHKLALFFSSITIERIGQVYIHLYIIPNNNILVCDICFTTGKMVFSVAMN